MATAAQHVTSLASLESRRIRLGRGSRPADSTRSRALVRREAMRSVELSSANWSRPRISCLSIRPASPDAICTAPPLRRGAGRAPDLRLHHPSRRRRSQQPLDGAAGGACQDGRAVCGLHERTHPVRGPVLHGSARLAALPMRRRDHRQRLCGAEHAAHDPDGTAGPRAHRARRQIREGTAFHR